MKDNYFILLLVSVFLLAGFEGYAQNSTWEKVAKEKLQNEKLVYKKSTPVSYNLFKLKVSDFQKQLNDAPSRHVNSSNVVIELPVADGKLQYFEVYEASVMATKLQEKYPSIQSYVAQGIDDPTAIARISISNIGVHIMISSGHYSTIYVDPYTEDKKHYAVYAVNSLTSAPDSFQCLVESKGNHTDIPLSKETYGANDRMLRTYKLALASTRQYANYHINLQGVPVTASEYDKKEAVLSEMNVAMTRINGVFERDLSVTMELVGNNDELIFLDATSDPYSNSDAFAMLRENQATVDSIIGVSNYDLGHVFSTGGGGVAYLGSVCSGYKAGGVTGLYNPIADAFYIDYVSHEMGHQFGANHTFNGSAGSCGGGNRNNFTAMEPGSGSTIMGYAGICAPQNVQVGSDSYFHATSISEMWTNITSSNSCAVETNTNNQSPIVDAGSNVTIPKSTPFVLDGTAIDPDGDDLTYTWEQIDRQIAEQPPVNSSAQGPLFRSMEPVEESYRYFPKMETILTGSTQSTWEVLPAVGRNLNFRLTVRDNVAGGGASSSDDRMIIVSDAAGPFVITSQNTVSTWETESEETITWDVADTDIAPVNCANVDILFSKDGGLTYPITLAQNVPNSGSAIITVPSEETDLGRIMVKASENIFFDVNNENIVVTSSMSVGDFTTNDFMLYPNPSSGPLSINFTPETTDYIEITLYDIKGKRIKQELHEQLSSSMFEMHVNYHDVDPGMYFVVIKNGDKSAVKRWIKR